MREETQRKLDGFKKRQQLRRVLVIGGALLAAGVAYVAATTVYAERELAGTVKRSAWETHSDFGTRYPVLDVGIDDGRVVSVGTMAPTLPEVGSRIVLIEEQRLFGTRTYRWEGPAAVK
jgi:hypothetical protein